MAALVVNTGGIAFYPSITVPDTGVEFALEIIAHEWAHQWLWFRPLGRRYFRSGDLLTLNETVASIAGQELGESARAELEVAQASKSRDGSASSGTISEPAGQSAGTVEFDFQAEMRATRMRVDELLAAGQVAEAEGYMEERRGYFVENGYSIRRLNQAYFGFHGSYARTGAAGVNVIGEQVEELRRGSPSLNEFLRTAAEIKNPDDLSNLLSDSLR